MVQPKRLMPRPTRFVLSRLSHDLSIRPSMVTDRYDVFVDAIAAYYERRRTKGD